MTIKSINGSTEIHGNLPTVTQDFVNVIRSVYRTCESKYDTGTAKKYIALCGKCAFADNESEELMMAESIVQLFAK